MKNSDGEHEIVFPVLAAQCSYSTSKPNKTLTEIRRNREEMGLSPNCVMLQFKALDRIRPHPVWRICQVVTNPDPLTSKNS